ncbi:MAG: 50S ribosomal protein L21 [Firmicutes bacterium]|nr:50S ribosomal protein L21 [Bacillota bacterium]MCL2255600.1 50S ribosomal protein L21 [Bacillota bacterium]
MYAIVNCGGKQFKVSVGDVIEVEKLEIAEGSKIELDVLMISKDDKVTAGEETSSVKASAEVVSHGKGKKLTVFTYKPKKNVRRKLGHRQPFTKIKITKIG